MMPTLSFLSIYTLYTLLLLCLSPSVLANSDMQVIETRYYTITLPKTYRKNIKQPKKDKAKSLLIAFDNRFMKTASIAIEASPSDDVDIDAKLSTLEAKIARQQGSLEQLSCTNACRATYAVIESQRKSEHFILIESDALRVDIQYLAEEDVESAKGFILSIANQIYPMTID